MKKFLTCLLVFALTLATLLSITSCSEKKKEETDGEEADGGYNMVTYNKNGFNFAYPSEFTLVLEDESSVYYMNTETGEQIRVEQAEYSTEEAKDYNNREKPTAQEILDSLTKSASYGHQFSNVSVSYTSNTDTILVEDTYTGIGESSTTVYTTMYDVYYKEYCVSYIVADVTSDRPLAKAMGIIG